MATQQTQLAPPNTPYFPTWHCRHCGLAQFKKPGRDQCLRCHKFLDPVTGPAQPNLFHKEPRPLSRRFRTIRLLKGISQEDLAFRMKTPRTYISKIETGRTVPHIDTLRRAATALGVTLPDLLGLESERRLALRTFVQGGTASEILVIVAGILPLLDQRARRELLSIVTSFKRNQLSFCEYEQI
jgi:transcriptional regulator with XRE-family HTH domain